MGTETVFLILVFCYSGERERDRESHLATVQNHTESWKALVSLFYFESWNTFQLFMNKVTPFKK